MAVTVTELRIVMPKSAGMKTHFKIAYIMARATIEWNAYLKSKGVKMPSGRQERKSREFAEGDNKVWSIQTQVSDATVESMQQSELREAEAKLYNNLQEKLQSFGCHMEFKTFELSSHDIS